MSRVPCRISMRLRYGSRLGIVSSRQSTTAELRLVDVLLEWTGYPSPPPAVSLRRRRNRTVEAPAMHVDGLSPYTANLCPLCGGVELAGFREDFGESVGELVETMLRSAVRQRATEQLDG